MSETIETEIAFAARCRIEAERPFAARLAQLRAELGDRRPHAWIPAAWDNSWSPTPGERVGLLGEPYEGVYEGVSDAAAWGAVRTATAYHIVGPTSAVLRVLRAGP